MIRVLYTCSQCPLVDIPVEVEARAPDEDIAVWMSKVTSALVADHAAKAPHCHPETFAHVKIPLPAGASRLGEPTKH